MSDRGMSLQGDNPPREQLRVWRRKMVSGLLHTLVIIGALAMLLPIQQAITSGQIWRIPVLVGSYAALLVVSFWRRVSYTAKVGTLLTLVYILGIYNLFLQAQTGDAFRFMMIVPFLATLLSGKRAGWIALAVATFILAAFGLAFVSGLIVPSDAAAATKALDWVSWAIQIVVFCMLSLLLIIPQNYLFDRLVKSLTQVREQVQQIRRIMDTVPEGVVLLDADCRIILANQQGKQDMVTLAGAGIGEALTRLGDRPLTEILTSPPKGLWHEVTKNHHIFQTIARPIESGPVPSGWVMVTRDVTQQYEAERRVRQQERLATVGQLAAGIAHDFNNIMAVIALYTGISLRTPDLPPKVHERLETIEQQSRRASDLIQQIMDFSRRAELERGPLDLVAFLKEQVKLLERTLLENLKIDLSYSQDDHTINADPTRIQQVIMNLATNARDAMPKGGLLHFELERITIENHKHAPLPEMQTSEAAIGDWVRLTAIDTGSGIPPEVQPHIFDPFFTTKSASQGTGLGLAQVYGIIKQHDGYIDFTAEVDKGTTFSLYLPALSLRQPETPVRPEHLPQGQGQTVLVVEDDNETRKALIDSLELLNYRVLEATNGREALEIVEQHTEEIALVLSDVVMPEMGGQALLHALKERVPKVHIVLLTGHPQGNEDFGNLRAQGLKNWALKPLSVEQLAKIVAEALE